MPKSPGEVNETMLGGKKLTDYMPALGDASSSGMVDKRVIKEMILYFIIIDLILFLIISWVWNYNGDKSFLEQLSLASSISSILLALVAIAYAFMQSNDSSRQNAQVQIGLSAINEKLSELISIKEQVNRIKETIDSKTTSVNAISDLANSTIEDVATGNQSGVKKKMETIVHLTGTLKDDELGDESYQQAKKFINQLYLPIAEQSPNSVYSFAIVVGKGDFTQAQISENILKAFNGTSLTPLNLEKLSETDDGISFKVTILNTSLIFISVMLSNTVRQCLINSGLDVWSIVPMK